MVIRAALGYRAGIHECPLIHWPAMFVRVTTDVSGHYRLTGLPTGEAVELLAVPAEITPNLPASRVFANTPAVDPTRLDFALKRGLLVRGRIADRSTQKPVAAMVEYHPTVKHENVESPHDLGLFEGLPTHDDGSFSIVAFPGPGVVTATALGDRFLTADLAGVDESSASRPFPNIQGRISPRQCHAFEAIAPEKSAESCQCELALSPGPEPGVTILDSEGQPLSGAMVSGISPADVVREGWWQSREKAVFRVTGLTDHRIRRLLIHHAGRRLAGSLAIRDSERGPLVAQLQPWCIVLGRLVDRIGRPRPAVRLSYQESLKDEGDAMHRKALRLPADRLIRVTDSVGMHPAMRDAGRLLESGQLAIVPGVGHPNPSRSPFRSMAIWHTARLDPEEHHGLGWLGRGLDSQCMPVASGPSSLFVGTGALPEALRGSLATASSLERIDDLVLDRSTTSTSTLRSVFEKVDASDDLFTFVRRNTLEAYAKADRFAAFAREDPQARYPTTALADRLGLIARLIKGGLSARVYYTVQGSYDTHAVQLGTHFRLLAELSGALKSFLDDLTASKLAEQVLVMCFSEFGRRVEENYSAGTDHGTSGLVFLAGSKVRPGLTGSYPSLTDLVDGDMKMTVDFRRIYATVLDVWLRLPSNHV